MEGVIIQGRGGLYTVEDSAGGAYVLRAKNRFRRQHISPLVGDRVLFTPGSVSDEHGWIDEILPRDSVFVRPPVANVTLMALVVAPEPAPDLLLVDRLLVQVRRGGLKAALIVNKSDLEPGLAGKMQAQYRGADVPVLTVSALTGQGEKELLDIIGAETVCLSGQSGVGKSTLINRLMDLSVETGDISPRIRRGRNTTRHVELFRGKDFRLMDTPGFSLITLETEVSDPVFLREEYPEFRLDEDCRFNPCYHQGEPGCAVRRAVDAGLIDRSRYDRYIVLLRETQEAWRNRYD